MSRKLRVVPLREELAAITDDMLEALILAQMLYWCEHCDTARQLVEEEQTRAELPEEERATFSFQHGWMYKGAPQLSEELFGTASVRSVQRRLKTLIDKGYLQRRDNPLSTLDRVPQFRVDLLQVQISLIEKGYPLNGYPLPEEVVAATRHCVASTRQSVARSRQSVGTLPESIQRVYKKERNKKQEAEPSHAPGAAPAGGPFDCDNAEACCPYFKLYLEQGSLEWYGQVREFLDYILSTLFSAYEELPSNDVINGALALQMKLQASFWSNKYQRTGPEHNVATALLRYLERRYKDESEWMVYYDYWRNLIVNAFASLHIEVQVQEPVGPQRNKEMRNIHSFLQQLEMSGQSLEEYAAWFVSELVAQRNKVPTIPLIVSQQTTNQFLSSKVAGIA